MTLPNFETTNVISVAMGTRLLSGSSAVVSSDFALERCISRQIDIVWVCDWVVMPLLD